MLNRAGCDILWQSFIYVLGQHARVKHACGKHSVSVQLLFHSEDFFVSPAQNVLLVIFLF